MAILVFSLLTSHHASGEFAGLSGHHDLTVNRIQQEKVQVSGSVMDKQGIGIPGANVVEKGTDKGTTTNANGDYTIMVEGPALEIQDDIKVITLPDEGKIRILGADEIRSVAVYDLLGRTVVKKAIFR